MGRRTDRAAQAAEAAEEQYAAVLEEARREARDELYPVIEAQVRAEVEAQVRAEVEKAAEGQVETQVRAEIAAAAERRTAAAVEQQAVERELAELVAAVAKPVRYAGRRPHFVTVMGQKGGVGKTPAAVALSHFLSTHRGDRVAAMDCNRDLGTLWNRMVPPEVPYPPTMIDLAAQIRAGHGTTDWAWLEQWHGHAGRVNLFTNRAGKVNAVEDMPVEDYVLTRDLVARSHHIVVQDMGTSVASPLAQAALEVTDTVVIASSLDGGTLADTLAMVTAMSGFQQTFKNRQPIDFGPMADGRYAHLLPDALVVLVPAHTEPLNPDFVNECVGWLKGVVGLVVEIPRDQHMGAAVLDWDKMSLPVVKEYLRGAGHIAAQLTRPALERAGRLDDTEHVPGVAS